MPELSQRARNPLRRGDGVHRFGRPRWKPYSRPKYGLDLSAASIRNVLADLEEEGYLAQPHTSSGRIPTDRALRFFIDTLMQVRAISFEQRQQMAQRFAQIYAQAEDPLREAGRYLSELSGAAAVVGAPKKELRSLSQIRFIPIRPGQLLAVLVFSEGTVENRFIPVDEAINEGELARIHNLLADVIEGRTLGDVRDLFARRLASDRVAVDVLRHRAFELGNLAMPDVEAPGEVVIEGQARLIDLPEYADGARLKKLVLALEERAEIVALLEKTLAAGAVTVFVRRETDLGGGELSLVIAPYAERGHVAGAVGVLGPTQMDSTRR